MYFPDLELCRYRSPFNARDWRAPLLAVGWLERSQHFTRGFAPHGLHALLERFVEDAQQHFEQYHSRGLHLCSLCEQQTSETRLIPFGFFNVLVPGDDVIYAAPAAIIHYVKAHYYVPPGQFLQAVTNCPPYGSDEYMNALRIANRGEAPPIERYQDVVRAFQEALAATAAARAEAASRQQSGSSEETELLSDVRKAQQLDERTNLRRSLASGSARRTAGRDD